MSKIVQTARNVAQKVLFATLLVIYGVPVVYAQSARGDPLPSWNDSAVKRAITDFVTRVTKEGGADFVPVVERIATFDNDGTLWAEQPMYFQLAFVCDRVKATAPEHPEWKDKEPFKSILAGNVKAALAGGDQARNDSQRHHRPQRLAADAAGSSRRARD